MYPFDLFSLSLDLARLGLDAQVVVAERMTKLARGDLAAGIEAVRMVTEKTLALGEANAHLASAAASGKLDRVAPQIVALYRRKVRANRRRLRKG
jgi:hypothetical protein